MLGHPIPDWLLREEPFTVEATPLSFIEKNLLSLLELTSRIRRSQAKETGLLGRVSPLLKLPLTLLLLLFLSLSRSFEFLALCGGWILLQLCLVDGKIRKALWALCSAAALFSFFVLLPSFFGERRYGSLLLLVKVLESVALAGLLGFSSSWHDLCRSLKTLRIPDAFILILDLSIRHLFLLAETAAEMLDALKLRLLKRENGLFALAFVLGNLFLKSIDFGKEVANAMACRGFSGKYRPLLRKNPLDPWDWGYLASVLALVAFSLLKGGGKG